MTAAATDQIPISHPALMFLERMAGRKGLWKNPGGSRLIEGGHLYRQEPEPIDGGRVKDVFLSVRFAIVEGKLERCKDCVWAAVKLADWKEIVAEGYRTIQDLPEHAHVARALCLFAGPEETIVLQPYYPKTLNKVQLPLQEAVAVMAKVAAGLAHLHMHRIIHRDVKPGNINLDKDGKPKLNDFDFAIPLPKGQCEIRPKAVGCSPEYAAPELLNREEVGLEVDVWSLAVTLYSVARQNNAVPPFIQEAFEEHIQPGDKDIAAMAEAIRSCEWREAPVDESWLQELIEAGLHLDREKRPTAAQFVGRLNEHFADDSSRD